MRANENLIPQMPFQTPEDRGTPIIAIEKWGFKMNNAEHEPKSRERASLEDGISPSLVDHEEMDRCGQTYFPSW